MVENLIIPAGHSAGLWNAPLDGWFCRRRLARDYERLLQTGEAFIYMAQVLSKTLVCEQQVAAVPGKAFDPVGDRFVDCCCAIAYEQIEEDMHRLEKFMSLKG
jgi:aspartate/methionine/tyrosine aminotransferase